MLSNTLNTNEIKDNAGTEVEFTHRQQDGSSREFMKINENPSQPHRLTIKHQEVGTGLKARRRSAVRFNLTHISTVDSVTPVTTSFYIVGDIPVGAITSMTTPAAVLANLLSFCATTGAATTVLFDGTGNGAKCLLNGEL